MIITIKNSSETLIFVILALNELPILAVILTNGSKMYNSEVSLSFSTQTIK